MRPTIRVSLGCCLSSHFIAPTAWAPFVGFSSMLIPGFYELHVSTTPHSPRDNPGPARVLLPAGGPPEPYQGLVRTFVSRHQDISGLFFTVLIVHAPRHSGRYGHPALLFPAVLEHLGLEEAGHLSCVVLGLEVTPFSVLVVSRRCSAGNLECHLAHLRGPRIRRHIAPVATGLRLGIS